MYRIHKKIKNLKKNNNKESPVKNITFEIEIHIYNKMINFELQLLFCLKYFEYYFELE